MKKSDLVLKLVEMTNLPKKVIEKVIEIRENDKKISYENISRKIKRELNLEFSKDECKKIWDESKMLLKWFENEVKWVEEVIRLHSKIDLQELNNIENKDKYEYEESKKEYTIYYTDRSTKNKFKVYIPLDTADQIHWMYSSNWQNKSWPKIQKELNLHANAWRAIVNCFNLNKDCHILSPISMEIAEREWRLEEVIEEATLHNFQDKYMGTYKEVHIKAIEKEYVKLAKYHANLTGALELIRDVVNNVIPLYIKALKHKDTPWVPIPVFHWGDTHLWKIDTELVLWRVDYLKQRIIKEKSKIVYINFLWDIFEAIMKWWMHIWQVETMGGIYGTDLFMYSLNVFENMLRQILESGKEVRFIGIGGNHDRESQINQWGSEKIFATLFYELLKAKLQNAKIEFQIIRDMFGKFEVDWVEYVDHHWEKLFNKKKPEAIAWNHATTGKHVVVVSAHEHNLQIYWGKDVTHLKIDAMAWQNTYDKDLDLHSYPWFSITRVNEFWIPDIENIRLP